MIKIKSAFPITTFVGKTIACKEFGTKRFQFLKILIIKPFKSIIKCEKRTKQNSDYQKTSFVRFLYLRSDFCPSLYFLIPKILNEVDNCSKHWLEVIDRVCEVSLNTAFGRLGKSPFGNENSNRKSTLQQTLIVPNLNKKLIKILNGLF